MNLTMVLHHHQLFCWLVDEARERKNPLFNSVLSRLQMALKQSVATTRQQIISAQITTNSFSTIHA